LLKCFDEKTDMDLHWRPAESVGQLISNGPIMGLLSDRKPSERSDIAWLSRSDNRTRGYWRSSL
jgi:hypothetical protein